LLIRERISVDDLKREYGVEEEDARKILNMLTEMGFARWIEEDAIGILPLKHYLNIEALATNLSGDFNS